MDFKAINTNISGAREAFENACETLFRTIYMQQNVQKVKVEHGDGGIDIFIGELGIEPITVIQCKFFLDGIGESQKSQIRNSFITAIESKNYELESWILCVPCIPDIDTFSWWFKWKQKVLARYKKTDGFIDLKNGNELIDLFKHHQLYNQVFKITDSIKIDEIHRTLIPSPNSNQFQNVNSQLVLFNNYSKRNEAYYHERNIDLIFTKSLELNCLWLYGNSGVGKTALIHRNLIKNELEYCYCDLSPIDVYSSESVILEIILKAEEHLQLDSNPVEKNLIKRLSKLLLEADGSKLVIVIDEISTKDFQILRNISNTLIDLVTYFSNLSTTKTLNFIISTIAEPKQIIKDKPKASQHFQYLNCNSWGHDIPFLFDLIDINLASNLATFKPNILEACTQSPRILKSIFRKIISHSGRDPDAIAKLIQLTLEEAVY